MIRVGTSGYAYPEWKGHLYPADLPASQMLAYYSARLGTVEINSTFYRMPTEAAVDGWASGTPPEFVISLKAPRRITHLSRLVGTEDSVRVLGERARRLGNKLGAVLFQLPPNMAKRLAVLDGFLASLPEGIRAAVEFRNATWFDQDVFDRLRAANVALCIADSDKLRTPMMATADFGYLRLRDEGYRRADLERWAQAIAGERRWKESYVYFKHEEGGIGPDFARELMSLLSARAA